MGAQQWRNAEESLLSLEKSNVDSVDSIIRYYTNLNMHLSLMTYDKNVN